MWLLDSLNPPGQTGRRGVIGSTTPPGPPLAASHLLTLVPGGSCLFARVSMYGAGHFPAGGGPPDPPRASVPCVQEVFHSPLICKPEDFDGWYFSRSPSPPFFWPDTYNFPLLFFFQQRWHLRENNAIALFSSYLWFFFFLIILLWLLYSWITGLML